MCRSGAFVFSLFLLTSTPKAQILPKGNVFVGYSYNRAGTSQPGAFNTDSSNLNGWEGSLEGKLLPFIGIVADVSGHYGSTTFAAPIDCTLAQPLCSPIHQDVKEYNFLLGPRVSVAVGKVRPFAHALFGAAHINLNGSGTSNSDTSFATAIGGGIDYHLLPLLGWRVQGDYLQTRFFSNKQNDFRFSTGLVLNF